jgi:hypothetical protein
MVKLLGILVIVTTGLGGALLLGDWLAPSTGKSSPTISEILHFVEDADGFPLPPVVRLDTFKVFDLATMSPGQGFVRARDSTDFWLAGYDSAGNLAEVAHVEQRHRIGNFRLRVFGAEGYTVLWVCQYYFNPDHIYLCENLEGKYFQFPLDDWRIDRPANGFFVRLEGAQRLHYLSAKIRHMGEVYAWYRFPILDMKRLWLADCDGELRLTRVFSTEEGRLSMFMDVAYDQLGWPSYTVYNFRHRKEKWLGVVDGPTPLSDLDAHYQRQVAKLRPQKVKSRQTEFTLGLPLWVNLLDIEMNRWEYGVPKFGWKPLK